MVLGSSRAVIELLNSLTSRQKRSECYSYAPSVDIVANPNACSLSVPNRIASDSKSFSFEAGIISLSVPGNTSSSEFVARRTVRMRGSVKKPLLQFEATLDSTNEKIISLLLNTKKLDMIEPKKSSSEAAVGLLPLRNQSSLSFNNKFAKFDCTHSDIVAVQQLASISLVEELKQLSVLLREHNKRTSATSALGSAIGGRNRESLHRTSHVDKLVEKQLQTDIAMLNATELCVWNGLR